MGCISKLFFRMFEIFECDPFVECRLATGEEMDTPAVGH